MKCRGASSDPGLRILRVVSSAGSPRVFAADPALRVVSSAGSPRVFAADPARTISARLRRALILLLVSLAVGCPAAEYEIAVDLRTDFVPGADFVATRAELFRQAPDEASEALERIDRPAFGSLASGAEIGAWNVAPGEHHVRAQLLTPTGEVLGEAVGEADVRARTRVTLLITRSCRFVRCDAGMTCMAGFCVALSCEPGECATECAGDEECAGTASCSAGRCESGACWFDTETDSCAPGEYCDPELGCVERPDSGVPFDAGSGTDAGPTVDAGRDGGPPPCVPDCAGRTCGLDPVCGTASCGACAATQTCSDGSCVDMPPDCSGLSCGPARNGVGGPDACGTCGAGFSCSAGTCVCGGNGAGCAIGSCCSPLVCSSGECCTPVQMACGSASECCAGRACQMGVCCVIVGDGCSMDEQCCNGHNCDAGRCCVRVGVGCSMDTQCCTGDCFMGACR